MEVGSGGGGETREECMQLFGVCAGFGVSAEENPRGDGREWNGR